VVKRPAITGPKHRCQWDSVGPGTALVWSEGFYLEIIERYERRWGYFVNGVNDDNRKRVLAFPRGERVSFYCGYRLSPGLRLFINSPVVDSYGHNSL